MTDIKGSVLASKRWWVITTEFCCEYTEHMSFLVRGAILEFSFSINWYNPCGWKSICSGLWEPDWEGLEQLAIGSDNRITCEDDRPLGLILDLPHQEIQGRNLGTRTFLKLHKWFWGLVKVANYCSRTILNKIGIQMRTKFWYYVVS